MDISGLLKKILDADNVWDGLYPVILFGQFGGFLPLKFDIKSQKSKISISIPYFLISMSFGVCYSYCFVSVIFSKEMVLSSKNYSTLLRIGDYSRIYISSFLMATIGLSFYYKINSYLKIFDAYFNTESLLCLLNHEIDYKKLKWNFAFAVFGQNVFNAVNLILHIILMNSWTDRPTFQMNIIAYTPGIFFSMILLIFCSMNKIAIYHLLALNEELTKILNSRSSKTGHFSILDMDDYKKEKIIFVKKKSTSKQKTDFDKMAILWQIYDSVCDTCDSINEVFSFKVLVIFAGSFIAIVFNLFNGLTALVELNSDNSWHQSTLLMIALHHGIVFLTVISIPISMCNRCMITVNICIFFNRFLTTKPTFWNFQSAG